MSTSIIIRKDSPAFWFGPDAFIDNIVANLAKNLSAGYAGPLRDILNSYHTGLGLYFEPLNLENLEYLLDLLIKIRKSEVNHYDGNKAFAKSYKRSFDDLIELLKLEIKRERGEEVEFRDDYGGGGIGGWLSEAMKDQQ